MPPRNGGGGPTPGTARHTTCTSTDQSTDTQIIGDSAPTRRRCIVADIEEFVLLDKRIDVAEEEGIQARWEFGRRMLADRGAAKRLSNGYIAALVDVTGKSRTELSNRLKFAEVFTEEQLSNALDSCMSWHEIVSDHLYQQRSVTTPGWRVDDIDRYNGMKLPELISHLINEVEWLTAWSACYLVRGLEVSLEGVAEMARAESGIPRPKLGASYQALKGERYADVFLQCIESTMLVQGLNSPELVYAYQAEWLRAVDTGLVTAVSGEVWVPAIDFPPQLRELRLRAVELVDAQAEAP